MNVYMHSKTALEMIKNNEVSLIPHPETRLYQLLIPPGLPVVMDDRLPKVGVFQANSPEVLKLSSPKHLQACNLHRHFGG